MSSDSKPTLGRIAGTDIGYDAAFERRWCTFERGVWLVYVLIITVGLLGLLGRGPLNTVHQRKEGVTATYERVVRFHTPTKIELEVPVTNGVATVMMDRKAFEKLNLKSVLPEPTRNLVSEDLGPLVFQAPSPADRTVLVQLNFEPGSIGPIRSGISVNGQSPLVLKQFMVP
jgi:hypothetical protein